MMWAACCLGFFAFLRCGEFTTNAEFDTQQHLSDRDIAVDNYDNPSLLSIHLKQSKTDQDRVGITLYVGQTTQAICPVAAMLRYLVARKWPTFHSGERFPSIKTGPDILVEVDAEHGRH